MAFKGDLQKLMQQFSGPVGAMAQVQGIAGIVLAAVYRDPDQPEPTDEVALLIVPKQAHMEQAVVKIVAEALVLHNQAATAPAKTGADN